MKRKKAIMMCIDGAKITRKEWDGNFVYFKLFNGRPEFGMEPYRLVIKNGELLSTITIPGQINYYSRDGYASIFKEFFKEKKGYEIHKHSRKEKVP